MTAPANGATVSGNVALTATASDNRGVAKVEFWASGKLLGTDTAAPYSYSWNTRKLSGSQTITARAYDAAGNMATSAPVSVTIGGSSSGGGKKNGR